MLQLNPASLDSDNNIKPESVFKKPNNNNRTYKNKKSVNFSDEPPTSNKSKINNISNLVSKLHTNGEDEDDDNNFQNELNSSKTNFGNYTPEKSENSNPMSIPTSNSNIVNNELNKMGLNSENQINNAGYLNSNIQKNFSNLDDSYKSTYDYINNLNLSDANTVIDNNKLLSKLDYIVHLLEENRNEKTQYITEELILYLFLGIFIIFVLDSFARASKYVR